jgi:hypothetical protein
MSLNPSGASVFRLAAYILYQHLALGGAQCLLGEKARFDFATIKGVWQRVVSVHQRL